jgi:hypothetical protein
MITSPLLGEPNDGRAEQGLLTGCGGWLRLLTVPPYTLKTRNITHGGQVHVRPGRAAEADSKWVDQRASSFSSVLGPTRPVRDCLAGGGSPGASVRLRRRIQAGVKPFSYTYQHKF